MKKENMSGHSMNFQAPPVGSRFMFKRNIDEPDGKKKIKIPAANIFY